MLKKLKNNKKGFTLMEMLVVVAIIAILIAIAIPTFSGALNKARAATDLANIRSGYASAQIEALTAKNDADKTYYLKDDGSVAELTGNAAPADAYKCQGAATSVADSKVGGRFSSTDIGWTKGQYITYVIPKADTNNGDALGSVTDINAN